MDGVTTFLDTEVEADPDFVDWRSIEFVRNGTPMNLSLHAPTLRAAVLTIGYMLTVREIAALCGTFDERIARIVKREPTAQRCPYCYRYLIPLAHGVAPKHVKAKHVTCGMSGYWIGDLERRDRLRAESKALGRMS